MKFTCLGEPVKVVWEGIWDFLPNHDKDIGNHFGSHHHVAVLCLYRGKPLPSQREALSPI